MANLTFRGYAKSKGFDPLDVPDETNKQLIETERTIKGMKEVRDQNYNNRQAVQAAIDKNYAKEAQQRNRNQGLLENFRDIYHKAELQHYETGIKDAQTRETEARRQYEQFNKLKDLSVTAFRSVIDFEKKRGANILENSALQTVKVGNILGLGSDQIYNLQKESLKSGVPLAEVLKQKHPNIPKHKIDKALGGWRGVAMQKNQWNQYIKSGQQERDFENWAATHKFPQHNNATFNELKLDKTDVTGDKVNGALSSWQDQQTKRMMQLGYSPQFVLNEMVSDIDRFVGLQRSEYSDIVQANDLRISNEGDQEKFLGLLDKDLDWRGAHDVILNKNIIESGNGGIARGLYVKGTKGFWSDEENLTYQNFYKFANTMVKGHNGNEVSMRKFFKEAGELEFYDSILPKINQKHARDRDIRKNELDEVTVLAYQDLLSKAELRPDGVALAPDYKEIKEAYTKRHGLTPEEAEIVFKPLVDAENREPISDQIARKVLNNKANSAVGISALELNNYSTNIQREFLSKTNEALGFDVSNVDAAYTRVSATIVSIAGQSTLDPVSRDWQVQKMVAKGKDDFFKYYKELLISKDYDNAATTLDAAEAAYEKIIENGERIYGTTDRKGDDFQFTHLQNIPKNERVMGIQTKLLKNPSHLNDPTFFTSKEKSAMLNWVQYGGQPPLELQMAAEVVKDKDVWDIATQVTGVKIERPGLANIVTAVSSENRQLVTNKTSLSRTFRATENTASKYNADLDANKLMLDSLISKDIYNYDSENPHNVFRTGNGFETYAVPLTEIQVSELQNMFANNSVIEAGAYGLTQIDIERGIANGVVSEADIFDEDKQRNIFRDKLFTDSSNFAIDGMVECIPGVGHCLAAPIKKSRRTLKKVTPLPDTKIGKFIDQLGIAVVSDPIGRESFSNLDNYLKNLIKVRKEEVADMPKKEGRGRIVQEVKQSIWQMDLAEKGFRPFQFTDVINAKFKNLTDG